MADKVFFTSESVTEGHPDKICDQISDAILDECLRQDPKARVACETVTKTGMVLVAGELTTSAYVDIPKIARQTLKDIGYEKTSQGIEWESCAVLVHLEEQSPDIAQGVNELAAEGKDTAEQGAGDQGMMFGYACNETKELMPLPIFLAHRLTERLSVVRKSKVIPYFGPDGKSQVTVEYDDGKPTRVDAIVISNQHEAGIAHDVIRQDVIKHVIKPVCDEWIDKDTKFYINPTGSFVRGGPFADAGLTGRKIIVDTYGGMGRHGGGAFSGKDPTKVDRSAAYAARYIAKNIVAAGIATRAEVQLAYAIGVAEPVSILVDTFGTGKVSEARLSAAVRKIFPTKPKDILDKLNLRRPIYRKTACNGHFGREEPEFTWEKTDKASLLRKELGL
ncbi:TPA: methionine adenosyltransferase [Candidatus Woesearchaeota archaeon]|nr:methionine adenosyltransferase [Candidatus Woesearchaeota archaeon]HII69364.1 methionine adenosyltransferase [Candidatus Woesearchaeota archaeon]